MKPVRVTITGAIAGPVIPMNTYISPFNVGFGVRVTGTINYTVQHTFDDVWSNTFDPTTAAWFSHPTVVAQTTAADGNYAFPVTGIRVLGNSGTGTATLSLIQAGAINGN